MEMEEKNKPEFLKSLEGQKKLEIQPMHKEIKHESTVFGILLRVFGILSAIICFIAGADMTSIRSLTGDRAAELFYNSFGVFIIGLAFFIVALLFGIAYLIEKK
ncbi:Uncharacterised protein [uncultured archaeon]|nr:Uncharacterised protein [uncultured archaeon]